MSKSKRLDITNVGDKFDVQKRIGAGCFGDVYRGVNRETGEEVAIKLESKSSEAPQLRHESEILDLLKNTGNGPQPQGFTVPCYYFGTEGTYSVMVIPMLSRSVEDCVQMCKGKLGVKTTLMIADQIIRRMEYLHSKGIIHRDIKPENFMWGAKEKQNILHVIDFGLSKRYHDGKTHVPFKQGRSLTGTARYASIKVHQGHEQGRRDDLEAIGHMLMYFLRGALPWSGLEAKTKEEKYRKIKEKKESVPLKELCDGWPACFMTFLEITRNLEFKERPDYKGLRKLFTDEFASSGFVEDFAFDWYNGKKPSQVTPLDPWMPLKQPDDQETSGGEGKKAAGGKSCCAVM
jgi:serine/threonine protein kinase